MRRCNICQANTKAGRRCKRTTCLGRNVPFCYQHLAAEKKKDHLKIRVTSGLKEMSLASRAETMDHMTRVYGDTPEERAIIEPQLINVFRHKANWRGFVYLIKKKVRAHVIGEKITNVTRFVRSEFAEKSARTFRRHVKPKTAWYIQSIGTDKHLRRRGVARILMKNFDEPIWLHAESQGAVTAYTRMGFKTVPQLTEGARFFMTR